MAEMLAAPGTILLKPRAASGEVVSKGGIVLPVCSEDTAGTYDNTRMGTVVACGCYQDRHAVPHDIPPFPLAPGSYCEHLVYKPNKTVDGLEVVRSGDLIRWAPPGEPPEWWSAQKSS